NEPFDLDARPAWNTGGTNTLDLLVQNTYGGGGVTGPVTVAFAQKKTVEDIPPESTPGFDDRSWRQVHLPHEYVVEGAFTQSADPSHGSLPSLPAWYRKRFTVPSSYSGKSVWIDFDGIFRKSSIWLNGQKLGEHPSGYIGCRFDIGSKLRY